MPAPKRPNYFQSQFLVVRDFQDEQRYHAESLQRHNLLMHDWGVVRDGLQVTKSGDNYVVTPGSAIDSLGREIVLDDKDKDERTITAAKVQQARGTDPYVSVTIKFKEVPSKDQDDKYPPNGRTENVTRIVQAPEIEVTKTPASDVIILARIAANGDINNSVRKLATSFIPRGTNLNLGDVLLDGALSFTSKGNTKPQVGLDYDVAGDQLRIMAQSQSGSTLDATHLTIKRDSGNVGIGTTTPGQKLEVAGALKVKNKPNDPPVTNDQIGAYFWDQAGIGPTISGRNFEVRTGGDTVSLRVNLYGNVGVGTGTTEIQSKLHIVGLGSDLPSPTGSSQSGGKVVRLRGKTSTGMLSPVLDIGSAGDKGFWLQSANPDDLTKNSPLLLNPNGGNVGIGTTEPPQHQLEVVGALKLGGTPQVTSDYKAAYFWNQKDIGPTIGGHGFEVRTGSNTPRLKINSAGDVSIFGKVNFDGHVGIGTTEPQARLHVVGSGNAQPATSGKDQSTGLVARLRGTTTAGATSPVLDIGSAGNEGFWLQSTNPADLTKPYPLILNPTGGNIGIGSNLSIGGHLGVNGHVGIGTSAPISSLHIRKDVEKGLGPTLTLMNGSGHKPSRVHIDLYTYSDPNQPLPSGRIICQDNEGGSGDLIFQTVDAPNKQMVERMKIDAATGNVSIGGMISCGGKILIKSAKHTGRYISARDETESWNVRTQNKQESYEEFTLELSSSREFKENISDITALEAMTTLQNLTPVKYDYKGGRAFRQNLGFIAEDMPDNLSSEDRKSISPFEVVPVLTRVAKEQQRVIAELQATVRTLQSDLKQQA